MTSQLSIRNIRWNALLILSLAAIVALLAPSVQAADRLRVELDEPFEVDGTVYEAATLTLRHVQHLNPTSTLQEVWVDGKCLGMMVARSTDSEGLAQENAMLFSRNPDHRLVLVGMTLRGERTMTFHRVGDDLTVRGPQPTIGPLVAANGNPVLTP